MNILGVFFFIFLSYAYDYPISPCPNTFSYKQNNFTVVGNLKIPIKINQFPVTVKLHLCLRAALKTKYAGLLELSQPAEVVLDRMRKIKDMVVNYTVRFPVPSPLPTVRKISVNNNTICEGLQVNGGVVTNIFLEHKFPINGILFENDDISANFDKDCGIIPLKERFYNVKELEHWPWLAAILIQRPNGLEFHCSGTLISDKFIITAAHCIYHKKYGIILAKDFVIYLGKHDLNKWAEPNSLIRMVNQIILHPNYSPDFLLDDIALLLLNEPIKINSFVRPICLWSGTHNLYDIIGELGIIVGWGKTHSNGILRMQPRSMQLPIATQEECLRSRKDFMYITSPRTLCAGLRNGTGPCNGDSGSGLMLIRNVTKLGMIWELRGIISLSLYDKYNQTCDLSQYLVFTDVAKFLNWILFMTD